jgi:hypothetical protein
MNPTGSNDVRTVEGYLMYLFNELEMARSSATSTLGFHEQRIRESAKA